jgi:hypothetical protein
VREGGWFARLRKGGRGREGRRERQGFRKGGRGKAGRVEGLRRESEF